MRLVHRRFTLLGLLLAGLSLGSAARADDEATAVARELTDAGARLFAAKDARGLVDTYLDDAEVTLLQKDSEGLKTEVRKGRTAIEAAYRELFQNDKPFQARNRVEHARYLGPEMLLITGSFELKVGDDSPLAIPFVQVRIKQGKLWLVHTMQLYHQQTP